MVGRDNNGLRSLIFRGPTPSPISPLQETRRQTWILEWVHGTRLQKTQK